MKGTPFSYQAQEILDSPHTPHRTRIVDSGITAFFGETFSEIPTHHVGTECLHGVDFRHDVGIHGQEERHREAPGEHEGAERFSRPG